MDAQSVYEFVGGDSTFQKLVDIFYARVEQDPVLRPLFPDDLEPGKRWQFLFLAQFFGGPARYIEERGHPRLRMRHNPFPIDQQARDHWLEHMLAAIDEVGSAQNQRIAFGNRGVRTDRRGIVDPVGRRRVRAEQRVAAATSEFLAGDMSQECVFAAIAAIE